jgi:hypothetical protein
MHEENEHGDGWSVVLRNRSVVQRGVVTSTGVDASMLVPDKAPELVPGKTFDVFQGRTKVCHIEILSWWMACDECNWFDPPVNSAVKNQCPKCKRQLALFEGTLAERQQQLEERGLA